ncbi:hypothetical protein [Haloarchaeobius sp. DFWS5]|uniref:hypothetical protein n=1 Tax=Haloarchaeobius sp. DFWS5 TaxID=3446114 RepID=UPI003EC03A1D
MIETTIRDPEKHETLRADSQGRINLGVQYAGRTVEIVVAESRTADSETTEVQQTIGDRPMAEHERQGMLFVRLLGLDQTFLTGDHSAVVDENDVDAETVGLSDVDWSKGYLLDAKNVARFEFDPDSEEQFPFGEEITAEPVEVSADKGESGVPVYRFENEAGGVSTVATEYVESVQRIFGYDPTEELSNVRVHSGDAPHPVVFRNPTTDGYIAVAPRVSE